MNTDDYALQAAPNYQKRGDDFAYEARCSLDEGDLWRATAFQDAARREYRTARRILGLESD